MAVPVEWKYERDFEDIFLGIWWEIDKESYNTIYELLKQDDKEPVGSDMIQELRVIRPTLYKAIYPKATAERQQVGDV